MGSEISQTTFSREQRQQYREKVQVCLDVFEQMLDASRFAFGEQMTGMEIELNLVDARQRPWLGNDDVLNALADEQYQAELARFNLELNVAPRPLAGDRLAEMETELRANLNRAEELSSPLGAGLLMIGILPTVLPETFEGDWMSQNPRYTALNDALLTARGENIQIDIRGPGGEHLVRTFDSLAPESACTSVQLHLQVRPTSFANFWNASQVLAGAQLAIGANSPYFLGHDLWAETRVEVFKQATDSRPIELRNQGVRPRVYFGENWITSIFDLFEENVRYFPALLPEISDEDPQAVLDAGGVPQLRELLLHNGTIYRWNRPVYDTADGEPHLRVENRVLPAGPSVIDTLANAAFYYGTIFALASDERPVWTRMPFGSARENFQAGARKGIDAELSWPGQGVLEASELVLRLLPQAHEGLAAIGVRTEIADRLLAVIEGRCAARVNGASWQRGVVRRLEARGLTRIAALHEMTAAYSQRMHSNQPVHTWDLPS